MFDQPSDPMTSSGVMIPQAANSNFVYLSSLRPGANAVVQFVKPCFRELRTKLLSMGLVPGQRLQVLSLAPLGDPMTIRLLGFNLALRLSEAAEIVVEVDV